MHAQFAFPVPLHVALVVNHMFFWGLWQVSVSGHVISKAGNNLRGQLNAGRYVNHTLKTFSEMGSTDMKVGKDQRGALITSITSILLTLSLVVSPL